MNDPVAQAALDRAIDDDARLLLLYQPIHDARTGEIRAVEALLRQRRSDGEIREASIITEAAEESGGPELYALDSMLVRRAYTEAAHWPVRLHINLSPREFEGDVYERLSALITSCGVDTSKVTLEITETSYIEDPERTMHMLHAIRELGVELWLDDFGTGHSSLTHLQHFPIDGIKLSGEFIRPLPGDARSAAITRALIALAHDVGVRVVAEEVENRAQLDFLVALGCDWIQGFLFSRPMRAEELEQLLTPPS
jgi:EAL domain-containing protein (putative c-di-GMP-specific phosphodiesterase class I)